MEETAPTAPPVVAVVVAHDPGPWFDDVVNGLAVQDYPNLRVLFLDAGRQGDLAERVGDRVPGAFVRRLEQAGGFGEAANEVLRLVEGSGFFCLMHDDVALDADAIRQMVEETYRSNAGVVGPKLVDWYAPEHLLEVGSAADKFATPAPLVDPGELDQEQHDAVRDVFFVSSACVLVRTDLFRALGGFDELMPFHGDDLDLCWRAHVAGARVLAVPAARARHRGALAEREPQLDEARLKARHRLRAVMSNYSPSHLLRVLPQHVLLSLGLALAALLTGRAHVAAAELGAWPWNLARLADIRAKRRAIRASRLVPDAEVRTLQVHGSARLSAYLRGRAARAEGLSVVGSAGRNLAATFRGGAPRSTIIAWVVIVVLFLVGCRSLLTDGVAAVGTLLPFPTSATELLRGYATGWNLHGLGSVAALPTGLALLGLGGIVSLGQMELLRTLLVILPLLLGYLGAWRLARPFGSQRGKLAAVVVYAAVPIGYNGIATGRWAGVLAYGALPWVVLLLGRLSGLPPFEPGPGEVARPFVARVAGLALLAALVTAFVPTFPLVLVGTATALLLGSLPFGGLAGMARMLGGAVIAALVALLVLHLPWGWSLPGSGNWPTLATVLIPGGEQRGFTDLARLTTGPVSTWWLGWAFVVVVVAALLLGREWRLAWASRAAGLFFVSLLVAWLADRGSLPFALPAVEVVLAPAAAAVALAAAAGAAAVERDVAGTTLSWRQPLGTLAIVAVALSVIPAIVAVPDGRWKLGTTDFSDSLAFLPTQRQAGDFRVLWIGDPRNLPGTPWELEEGLGYSLSRDGAPGIGDLWALAPTRAERQVAAALELAADGQTARLGRLLGPMSIRYVVVPSERAPASAGTPSHPAPSGLTNALASQLDLKAIDLDDALTVYENTTWIPVKAQLSPGAAAASAEAGFDVLVRADLTGSTAVLDQPEGVVGASGRVEAGTVFVGESSSPDWKLAVDGKAAKRSPAFGWANAFEVPPAGGQATLGFETSPLRWAAIAVQAVCWLVLLWLALRMGQRRGRRRATGAEAAVLIDLGDEPLPVAATVGPDDAGHPAPAGAAAPAGGGTAGSAPPVSPSSAPSGTDTSAAQNTEEAAGDGDDDEGLRWGADQPTPERASRHDHAPDPDEPPAWYTP